MRYLIIWLPDLLFRMRKNLNSFSEHFLSDTYWDRVGNYGGSNEVNSLLSLWEKTEISQEKLLLLEEVRKTVEEIIFTEFSDATWLKVDVVKIEYSEGNQCWQRILSIKERLDFLGYECRFGIGPTLFTAYLALGENTVIEDSEISFYMGRYPVVKLVEFIHWIGIEQENVNESYLRGRENLAKEIAQVMKKIKENKLDTLEDILRLGRRGARMYLGELGEGFYDILLGRLE